MVELHGEHGLPITIRAGGGLPRSYRVLAFLRPPRPIQGFPVLQAVGSLSLARHST